MRITRTTPVIVRDGREVAVTTQVIAALLAEGLTPRDYEVLALVADACALTIADLIRLALEREGQP